MSEKQRFFSHLNRFADRFQQRFERGMQYIESQPAFQRLERKINRHLQPLLEKAGLSPERIAEIEDRIYTGSQRQIVRAAALIQRYYPDFEIADYLNLEYNPILRSYLLLGVPFDATAEEIKTAYHQKMRQHHPDHHAQDSQSERLANDKAQQIIAAYKMLKNVVE